MKCITRPSVFVQIRRNLSPVKYKHFFIIFVSMIDSYYKSIRVTIGTIRSTHRCNFNKSAPMELSFLSFLAPSELYFFKFLGNDTFIEGKYLVELRHSRVYMDSSACT